jgi:hypothetical protein
MGNKHILNNELKNFIINFWISKKRSDLFKVYLQKAFPKKFEIYYNLIFKVTNFLENDGKNGDVHFQRRLYHIANNKYELIKCPVCNKNVKYVINNREYYLTCSITCSNKSVQKRLQTKNTNLEKYECENVFQNENIKLKSQKSCMEKYGTKHHLQNLKIKEKLKKTNFEKYGTEYVSQNQEIKEKIKKTNLERYNAEYIFKNEDFKNKMKELNLEKYGCENVFQNENIKKKIKKSNLEKYGFEYISQIQEIKEKIKETNLKKYGVSNPMQSEKVKTKSKNTCMEKYGVEHPMQNTEIFEKQQKSSFLNKKYILPSGSEINVQGYEPFALNILLKKYNESEIITSAKQINNLIGKSYYTLNRKKHIYYPDIYIPKENKIIEVKSNYTYKKELKENNKKRNSIINKNIIFEFWIFDTNGNLEII